MSHTTTHLCVHVDKTSAIAPTHLNAEKSSESEIVNFIIKRFTLKARIHTSLGGHQSTGDVPTYNSSDFGPLFCGL